MIIKNEKNSFDSLLRMRIMIKTLTAISARGIERNFVLTLSGLEGGSEARMAKLTAANQKPVIL